MPQIYVSAKSLHTTIGRFGLFIDAFRSSSRTRYETVGPERIVAEFIRVLLMMEIRECIEMGSTRIATNVSFDYFSELKRPMMS